MKKLSYLLIMLLFFLLLCSCSNKNTNTTLTTDSHDTQLEKPNENNAFSGSLKVEQHEEVPQTVNKPEKPEKFIKDTDERNIAVMIDNDNNDAWPQAGLEDSYLIYEAVVEGGATRFMALFKGTDTKKIGPIRSSRHYFLDYAMENDAIYVHIGWSPYAERDIKKLGINNINGILGSDGWIFWREPKRKYDYHDAYTNIEKIKDMVTKQKGYRSTSDVSNFTYYDENFTPQNGVAANKITIPYSLIHTTYYEYDKKSMTYKRWMRKTPHKLSTTENQLATKNIIIQFAKNYPLGDAEVKKGRQELDTVGSGNGYFITNGKAIKITWKKESRKSRTIYLDSEGNEIKLNDGPTWIQITPTYSKVTIE